MTCDSHRQVRSRRPSVTVDTSVRELSNAGARPKSSPVRVENAIAYISTRQSKRRSMATRIPSGNAGMNARSRSSNHTVRATPAAPAISESRTLSAISCLTIRKRLAPIASRTAISLRRTTARASSMLARFMQAMRSTRFTITPTSATSAYASVCMLGWIRVSRSGSTDTNSSRMAPEPSSFDRHSSGWSACISRLRRSNRALACSIVVPGSRRPTSTSHRLPDSSAGPVPSWVRAGEASPWGPRIRLPDRAAFLCIAAVRRRQPSASGR